MKLLSLPEKERLLRDNRQAFEAHFAPIRIKLIRDGIRFRQLAERQADEWRLWLTKHPDPK